MEFIVRLNNVSKSFKNQKVLNKVNINIKKGNIYGLIGENGAGKTTIMKAILGLTPIDEGDIEIFGKIIKNYHDIPYFKIGNMIETPSFYPNLTAKENLQVLCKTKGLLKKNSIDEILEKVGLTLENKKTFSQFSLGMKQRLGLANAMILDPMLLILDEPTNGLDPNGIIEVRKILNTINKEFGTTILISSHILSEVEEIADMIGTIQKGTLLIECPISEIYNQGKKYILIKTNNITSVLTEIEQEFGIYEYEVISNEEVKIFCDIELSGEINTTLIKKGIHIKEIISSYRVNNYLEEFYMNSIGENNDRTIKRRVYKT